MATEQNPQGTIDVPPILPPRDRRPRQPARVIPFPSGAPTKEEADAANAGKYAPTGAESLLHRLARNWVVRLGLAGGASYAAYQVPAIHEYVDARYQDLLKLLNPETVVPPIFDNSLNEGIIGDNNILHLSLPEINQRFPQQVREEGNFLYFLSPIVLPDGTRMPYGKKDVWEIGGANYPTEELNKEAKEKNIKHTVEFTLPAGSILISPVDGYGYIDMGRSIARHDPNLALGFFVIFHDEVHNKTYKIWVFGQDLKTINYNLVSLNPSLEMPADKLGNADWKNWLPMKRGQPLIKATKDQLMRLTVTAYRGGKIDANATLIDKTQYLLTPRFYTDPATQKLVALGK